MDAVTNTLNEVGRGTAENNYEDEDVGAMRRAVFTIIQPDPTLVGKPPNAQTGVSGDKYATDQGYKVGEFRVQSEATNEAVDMLLELRNIQESYGTTGLSAKLEGFVAGVIGQAGQLRDVFFGRDAPGAELFQNNLADKTTAADLLKTATDVLGVDRIQQLSRIDALRLTLAAKMARAVDPSGRLSNQDFEIQLERLGQSGIFTTQTGAIARLDTVIEEFQNRQKEQEMMAEILGKSSITVEDRRFIQATNYVTKIQRHRKKSGIIAQTVGTDDPAVPTPDPNSDLIEMQDAPGFFQRPGSITPLDAQGNDATEAFMRKYYPQKDGQSS